MSLQNRLLFYLFTTALLGVGLGGLSACYIAIRVPYWPLHPDAVHVVPFNNHGTVHYMEWIEGFWITNVWWVVGLAWLALAGFIIWSRLPDRHGDAQDSN